ncbi:MAG: hypothetical protein Q7S81_03580 [bacterium]|nr:hypothetical protein [bacterium]
MENEIPDFNSWLELESVRNVILFKDRTALMEVRKYRKRADDGIWRTGTAIYFFGKEALKLWNIFVSDEEIIFGALKTDEGKWEISVPVFKEGEDESEKNKGTISPHVGGEENPFIIISIVTANGRIERTIFKNDVPPR